jgi:hypothetical protein
MLQVECTHVSYQQNARQYTATLMLDKPRCTTVTDL